MEKKCSTCIYEDFTMQQYPCLRCGGYSRWEQKEEMKDSKQLWSELLTMYITELDLAMGNDYNECDTVTRDIKKDTFIEKLGKLCEAIKEECW